MLFLDFFVGFLEVLLVVYTGLKLYQIDFLAKKLLLIVAINTLLIWTIRIFVTNILWQTAIGVTLLIILIKYIIKTSWRKSIIAILTSYLILMIGENIIIMLGLKFLNTNFAAINQQRGSLYYTLSLLSKIPLLITAILAYYKKIYIAKLKDSIF